MCPSAPAGRIQRETRKMTVALAALLSPSVPPPCPRALCVLGGPGGPAGTGRCVHGEGESKRGRGGTELPLCMSGTEIALCALIALQSQLWTALHPGAKFLEAATLGVLRGRKAPMATETLEPITRQQQELGDLLKLSLLETPAPL